MSSLMWNWRPSSLFISQNHFLHFCYVHTCTWCAVSNCTIIIIMDILWPFSNSLHHFLKCCTCIKPLLDPFIKWLWTWMEETRFAHKNWITLRTSTRNKFSMSLSSHINLSPAQNLSHWSLHHLLHLTPIKSATSYLKIKHLKKSYTLGNLITEHAL